MRKVILGLAVSLDGYIEGPNGEYDWCFTDQDYGMSEFFNNVDAAFMGRKSYEMTLAMGEAASTGFPKLKRYVFSNTLEDVQEGVTIIRGDIKIAVDLIKNESGKDIWLFGGAGLTTSLMNLDLVDRLWLAVHPIILGSGKPLFQDISQRKHLKLLESKSFDSGLVSLTYSFDH